MGTSRKPVLCAYGRMQVCVLLWHFPDRKLHSNLHLDFGLASNSSGLLDFRAKNWNKLSCVLLSVTSLVEPSCLKLGGTC